MHKTHVATILFEFGNGLGEIKRLHHQATLDLDWIKKNLQSCISHKVWKKSFGLMEKMSSEHEDSMSVRLPIILLHCPPSAAATAPHPAHLGLVTSHTVSLTPGHRRSTTPSNLCDELAKRYFKEMNQIPLPAVKSPDINGGLS
jgi:hypothetical protein